MQKHRVTGARRLSGRLATTCGIVLPKIAKRGILYRDALRPRGPAGNARIVARSNDFRFRDSEFSLLGGPLQRLGARFGLVRGGTNTVALGLAFGWVPWLVLVVLALAEGGATKIFILPVVAVHARLLLAVPLLFAAETALDAKFREFVTLLVRWGCGTARFVRTGGRCRASPALEELLVAGRSEPPRRGCAVAAMGADASFRAGRA